MKKVRSKLLPTKIGVIKTFSLSPSDEIGEIAVECTGCTYYYNNLAELCEKWEDYEDELYYIISAEHKDGYICALKEDYKELCETAKELGIGFETEKEAEKAVEKLKAWKRLKDKGFVWQGWEEGAMGNGMCVIVCQIPENNWETDVVEDLDLLFGGEE